MPTNHRAVAIVSGGLDSVTLAYQLHEDGYDLTFLGFDYGQRHVRELRYAQYAATRLGAVFHVVPLRYLGGLLGSALTDPLMEIPHGHYEAESMKATVVPNRNALMLDVAVAVAVSIEAGVVAFGAHAGDHAVYPDCRPEFVAAFERAARIGNEGFIRRDFRVYAPFLGWSKADIVALGAGLGVPFSDTWSCYEGGAVHCGKCGTCVERREAFEKAGVYDPTVYG